MLIRMILGVVRNVLVIGQHISRQPDPIGGAATLRRPWIFCNRLNMIGVEGPELICPTG